MQKWPDTSWILCRSIGTATACFSVGLGLPAAEPITDQVAGQIADQVTDQVADQVAGQIAVPALVINEVFFRGTNTDLEFVELFNASATSVDLSTIHFSDSRRKPVSLSESRHPLEPGGYAVITRDGDAFDARFSFSDRIEISAWPALNNSGDAVILWVNGVAIDSMAYSTSWGGNGVSLERIDPGGPSAARSNWAESLDRLGGTPGRLNSVFARDVDPPRALFCEEIEDGLLAVYFSEPLAGWTVTTSSFWLESGAMAASANLDASAQVVILEIGPGGDDQWVAISGVSDQSGNVLTEQQIRIAWLPAEGELILNEIMYEPLADQYDGLANQTEYVELLSTTGRTLSIRSLVLTDQLRENGTRDTTTLSDRRLSIEPGTIVLVYAHRDLSVDPFEAFPDIDRSNPRVTLLPIAASSLSFGNNGDKIRLERSGGVVVDEVDYAPSWHLAERVETRGISLERISATASSQSPANWSSSVDPAGGTPGSHNSIRFESEGEPVPAPASLTIEPSPFSPDGDGFEDVAFIHLTLEWPTAVMRAWVFDLSGRSVIELEQARPVGPSSTMIWNGRDRNGDVMQTGVYIILIETVAVGGGHLASFKKPVVLVRP